MQQPHLLRTKLLVATLAATIILGTAPWVLLTVAQSRLGTNLILRSVNKNLPGSITCKRWHLSIARGRLTLGPTTLLSPGADTLATLESLILEIDWVPLLHRTVHSTLFEINRLDVYAVRDTLGNFNLLNALTAGSNVDKTASPQRASAPVTVSFDRCRVTVDTLCYRDNQVNLAAATGPGTLTLHATTADTTATLAARLAGVQYTSPDFSMPVSGVAVDASVHGTTLDTLNIVVNSAATSLRTGLSATNLAQEPIVVLNLLLTQVLDSLATMVPSTPPLSGTATLRASFQGAIGNPDATLELTSGPGTIGATPVGDLYCRLSMIDRAATVDSLIIAQKSGGKLQLAGQCNLKSFFPDGFLKPPVSADSLTFAATVAAEKFDPAPYVHGISGPLSGSLRLAQQGVSPGFMAAQMQAKITSPSMRFSQRQDPVTCTASLGASIRNATLLVDTLFASAGRTKVSGSGRYRFDTKALSAQINALAPCLDSTIALFAPMPVSGKAAATMAITGTVKKPQISIVLQSDSLRWQEYSLGSLSLLASFDSTGTATVSSLDLHNGDSHLSVVGNAQILEPGGFAIHSPMLIHMASLEGSLDLDGSYNMTTDHYAAAARFEQTPLEPWFALAGSPAFGGSATGQLRVSGNLSAPDSTVANIDLTLLDVLWEQTPLLVRRQCRAQFYDRVLKIDGMEFGVLDSGYLKLSGSIDRDGTADVTATALLPLGAAAIFAPDLGNPQGTLNLQLQLNGNITDPTYSGTVLLSGASLTIPYLDQQIHAAGGAMHFTGKELAIDSLTGNLDDGRFVLTGVMPIDKFKPRSLTCDLEALSLPVHIPDMLDTRVGASLHWAGPWDSTNITGSLTALEGTYYQNIKVNLLESIGRRKRPPAPARMTNTDGFLSTIKLDIAVTDRQPFEVDNTIAHMKISTDLRLVGTAAVPVLLGRATVREGIISYQKKNFVISRGVVDFLDPYTTTAQIDMIGTVPVRDWKISLAVEGTPEDLTFKLTSNPPEEHQDILSLLLFNRTTRELAGGEQFSSKSTEQLLARVLESTFGDAIRKATGLDILTVETGTDTGSERDRIRVTLGKKLSRRLTTTYTVETVDGALVQQAGAEYKLFENLAVTGYRDSRDTYGGQIRFRLEFR